MPNVYAAVFDSRVVKFGRSKNPYKRISDHITAAKSHGALLTDVFLSCVANDARDEELLLSVASDQLSKISRESFRFDGLDDVGFVFDEARIPYIICGVQWSPYRLIIDHNSFPETLVGRPLGKPVAKLSAVETRIIEIVRKAGEIKASEIIRAIPEFSGAKVERYLNSMSMDGPLVCRRNPEPFWQSWSSHNLYKMKDDQ